jgi:hypothetical protein
LPHRLLTLFITTMSVLVLSRTAFAQGGDLTLFLGSAYPVYDDRLTLRPSTPSLPGAEITVTGNPELRATGGLVVGGALAFEIGVFGIEGRLDSTALGFDLAGARYDLRATSGPLQGLTGAIIVGDGEFDAERVHLLSINARLRTPGPIGLVASGGFSFLPDVTIGGSVPLSVQIAGLPLPPVEPRLFLRAAPGESDHRYGINGGAGLRIGGDRVAFMAEVRAFYFREYELRFAVEGAPEIVEELLERVDSIRFEPVIVNANAGLVFRF